jgi:hypothetical protein
MNEGLRIDTEIAITKNRFHVVEGKFTNVEGRFSNVERVIELLNDKFDGKFDDKKFDGLERKFDSLERKFDALERKFDTLNSKLQGKRKI